MVFSLVHHLIRLALTLPVATASVERVFSAMNIIKTDLLNKMGDDWLNDGSRMKIEIMGSYCGISEHFKRQESMLEVY